MMTFIGVTKRPWRSTIHKYEMTYAIGLSRLFAVVVESFVDEPVHPHSLPRRHSQRTRRS